MTLNVFGQVAATQSQAPQPSPNQQQGGMGPVFIVAVQMGTDTLKKGDDTVKLTEETLMEMKQAMASPDYTVILNPRGDCGQLSLVKTTAGNFIVKQQKNPVSSGGIFDYVVFAKQRRPMMPMHPHPPVPQPTPGGQQQAPPAPPQKQ